MPNIPSSAAIQEIRANILKLFQNMDDVETNVMTGLGFSDIPAWWADEAGIVLADLARSARQAAAQQIRVTGQSIRGCRMAPSKELAERVVQIHEKELALSTTLQELGGLTPSELDRLGAVCRDAIKGYLPQLRDKMAAFHLELSPLRATIRELLPLYVILESPRRELEATLDTLFPTNLHENLIRTGVAAVRQLSTMTRQRRALLERKAELTADLMSPVATVDKRGHAWNELRGLSSSLGNQVICQRLSLDTITDIARFVQNDFPVLPAVLRGKDVTVQELLEARDKHRRLAETLDELSQRAEHLGKILDNLKNLLDLGNGLAASNSNVVV